MSKFEILTGDTALAIAARRGEIETFKALLTAGADLNTTDNLGRTPLHLAASFGHEKLVALLLQGRPNLDAVTLQGYTAFRLAMTWEIKKMLKDAGAVLPVMSEFDLWMGRSGTGDERMSLWSHMELPERSMTASPDPFYFSHRLSR
jgi:Ankyrin repeats (3 copies)